jgi:hypothetical protein
MNVAGAKIHIPAFPAAEIEKQIREQLAEETQIQAQLRGVSSGGGATTGMPRRNEPEIDSLVAVEILISIEQFVPFGLSENLIQPGGYPSIDSFANDLMPKIQGMWHRHYEGNSND